MCRKLRGFLPVYNGRGELGVIESSVKWSACSGCGGGWRVAGGGSELCGTDWSRASSVVGGLRLYNAWEHNNVD